jgi:DNA-3-methyladenine glycosylase II
VCGQQLSTASAAAIRARLFAAFDPFHHDTVRRARADKLKRLGLSAPKIKSIREIGKAVAQGRVDLTAVGNMNADEAHATLTALHGIGPWTADIICCSVSVTPMRFLPAISRSRIRAHCLRPS